MAQTRIGRCVVTIYRDAEWGEYRVRPSLADRPHRGGWDYFTNDRLDARQTAATMVRSMRRRPECRR